MYNLFPFFISKFFQFVWEGKGVRDTCDQRKLYKGGKMSEKCVESTGIEEKFNSVKSREKLLRENLFLLEKIFKFFESFLQIPSHLPSRDVSKQSHETFIAFQLKCKKSEREIKVSDSLKLAWRLDASLKFSISLKTLRGIEDLK